MKKILYKLPPLQVLALFLMLPLARAEDEPAVVREPARVLPDGDALRKAMEQAITDAKKFDRCDGILLAFSLWSHKGEPAFGKPSRGLEDALNQPVAKTTLKTIVVVRLNLDEDAFRQLAEFHKNGFPTLIFYS